MFFYGSSAARAQFVHAAMMFGTDGFCNGPGMLAAMKLLRRLRRLFSPDPNRFLRSTRGVIHVGANVGQERELYRRHGLDVLWIEPIPDVFARLAANMSGLPRQRALERLVTDRDDATYEFHISNNDGESSSILDLKQHRDI